MSFAEGALINRRVVSWTFRGSTPSTCRSSAPVAPYLRLAFGLCALLGGVGTILSSPTILLVVTAIAALAAASPVHPFDLVYNGIRHLTGTGPLPRRGAPSRLGCGMGAVLLLVTAWAFAAGHVVVDYALGRVLTFVALLVSTTDICIPSIAYRSISAGRCPRCATERMIAMALFILNDAPYGTERSYNGLRLAGALSKREGFEGSLQPDAAIFR